jgi:hypothetical protein
MEPIELIIAACVVYIVYRLVILNAKRKLLSYRIQTAMQQIEKTTIECSVEEYGGVFYLWEKETKKFLTQGNSIEDVFLNAKKYFPNIVFTIEEDNLKELLGISALPQLQ